MYREKLTLHTLNQKHIHLRCLTLIYSYWSTDKYILIIELWVSGHFIAVGDDKRIYWNDTKRACCDYQLWDSVEKIFWCEAESNSINNNGVCTSTFHWGHALEFICNMEYSPMCHTPGVGWACLHLVLYYIQLSHFYKFV